MLGIEFIVVSLVAAHFARRRGVDRGAMSAIKLTGNRGYFNLSQLALLALDDRLQRLDEQVDLRAA